MNREGVLLNGFKLGLRIEWDGYTIGMQKDGSFYFVAKNDAGEERLFDFPMDFPLFFKIAKEMSEMDIITLTLNCVLNTMKNRDMIKDEKF